MPKRDTARLLQRCWMHSHEEDTGTELVFRPANYDFPPSRGRRSFELKADGTLVDAAIGPVDRSLKSTGRWRLEDSDRLALYAPGGTTPRQVLHIVSVDDRRLVVKK